MLLRDDRVPTLLHLLGDDVAEQVFGHLDPVLAADLKRQLAIVADDPPSPRKQQQVLDEFERFFRFVVQTVTPAVRMHDPESAEKDEEEENPPPRLKVYQPKGDSLVDLEKMNLYQLSGALNEEQPRTVALLLNILPAKRTAELLSLFTEQRREAVAREISRDPRAPEVILRRIASTVVERAITLPPEPPKQSDPIQRMVDVLRETDKAKRREILRAIEEQEPERAAEIQQNMYRFDDLLTLDNQQIQQVLSRIDSGSLSTALFGADKALLDKIFSNLSKRARASLEEELGYQKNVSGAQLKAARDLVARVIAEADQEAE